MILIGQYVSPFTRRVAIALHCYGIVYRHEPWSAFTDIEKIAYFNPVMRVPTLVLDSGEALIESAAILDYLDDLVGAERALLAPSGEERYRMLRICALATSLCEKLVSIIYEKRNHTAISDTWLDRCENQVCNTLTALERERSARPTPFWFGDHLTHADIAVACAMTFMAAVNPDIAGRRAWAALAGYAHRCEQLTPFRATAPVFQNQTQ